MESIAVKLHHHAHKIWILSLVKRQGSLAGAALEARVSTSAVSQAITLLESLLGLTLLERGARGVRLTEAGERLLGSLESALQAFETFDPASIAESDTPRRLRLGAYESIAVDLLPRFVPALRARWPRTEIELCVARSRELLEKCRHGELDVVFVADPTHVPNLHMRSFARDTYGLFASRELVKEPLRAGDAESLVRQMGLGALGLDDKHHTRSFRRYLKALAFPVRPTFETESFEVILALVRGGVATGALPLRVARRAGAEIVNLDEGDRAAASAGEHELSLACTESFSKRAFDELLALARG
jgi:molybdate transport repressor ModE-like protein